MLNSLLHFYLFVSLFLFVGNFLISSNSSIPLHSVVQLIRCIWVLFTLTVFSLCNFCLVVFQIQCFFWIYVYDAWFLPNGFYFFLSYWKVLFKILGCFIISRSFGRFCLYLLIIHPGILFFNAIYYLCEGIFSRICFLRELLPWWLNIPKGWFWYFSLLAYQFSLVLSQLSYIKVLA